MLLLLEVTRVAIIAFVVAYAPAPLLWSLTAVAIGLCGGAASVVAIGAPEVSGG